MCRDSRGNVWGCESGIYGMTWQLATVRSLAISLHKVVSTRAIVMNLVPETVCVLQIFSTFKGLKEFDKNDKNNYNLRTYTLFS